jgi:hypothetical protein
MDNREAFEKEWAVTGMPKDKQRLADAAWQACTAHHEAIIKQLVSERDALAETVNETQQAYNALLAVIAQKDEALTRIGDITTIISLTESIPSSAANEVFRIEIESKEALALTPKNLRLVEVGMARRVDGSSLLTMDSFDADKVPAGTKLYTIEKGE